MAKDILVYLTTGFEEIEALATVDILRRAGLSVKTVSLVGNKEVVGSHQIPVIADILFEDVNLNEVELLVLPGGTPKFDDHNGLKKHILEFNSRGKNIAAICASPMVFGGLGLLRGKRATCYPGFEKYLEGATLATTEAVVIDGNIVTGRGPGLTLDFALTLVEIVAGKTKRDEVASGLLLK